VQIKNHNLLKNSSRSPTVTLYIDEHHISEANLEKIKDTINGDIDEFGVSTVELLYNQKSQKLYCTLNAPDENAVMNHHRKFGLKCDSIMPVQKIHTKTTDNTARLAAIGELASRLAHDLRNPLSVIKNTVEIMESKQKFRIEERIIYYNRLHRAIGRISHQIEDVLDFVRPLALNYEKRLINEAISSAVEKITVPDSVKINLPTNFVYLICDFTKLEVVFTNLIMNSIQAMNNSGQIDIRLFDLDKYVIMQISDTGGGIPQSVMPKIFDPLFTTKQEGTGLGLASCKKIIDQHDGTIDVSSVEGKGTTFTIKIPKQKQITTQTEQQKRTLVIS
jgi:two-component system sensor histidine kinase HydH